VSFKRGEAFSDFVVTGVALPHPGPTSIDFDFVLPFRRVADVTGAAALENWRGASTHTYVLLESQARPEALEAKMPDFVAQHLGADMVNSYQYRFQPLREVHPTPEVTGGLKPTSSPAYAYILSAIALIVLLLACINFTNLAVARAAARAREVGVRKLVGARRNQLMMQFWGEALLLSGIALLAGLALADLLLPTFNHLADKTLVLEADLITFGALAGVAVLVGLVAGSYPALVLSGFQPVTVLKGSRSGGAPGGTRRILHPLIVAQFGLSVFLMISTLVMREQLGFIEVRNVGFEAEQVVVVPTHSDAGAALLARYRAALDGHPEVRSVSGSAAVPGRHQTFSTGYVEIEGGEAVFPGLFRIEAGYLETMGLRLTEGRDLTDDFASDTTASVLVNEAMVQAAGWANPVGQRLAINGSPAAVVGVVGDFNYESLHHAVGPALLHRDADWPIRHILVRIAPEDLAGAVAVLQEAWSKVAPEFPFDSYFLDEDLARQYEADERWSAIVGYAAFLALLIACLGLFGLAALSTAQRTKEIGIRKVLGASVHSVTLLLSKDFARLVVIGLVVAAPVAYIVMLQWLDNFAYRIEISWRIFLMAGLIVLLVAILTVSYQAIKAALADPVKSLRYE
jgi:putative ABC transport system permease protein